MTLPRDDEGKVIRTGQATKKDRGSALLAGVLKCGTCGHVLTRSFTTRNGKRYDFYTCKRDPRCTAPASASALKVEPLIVRDFLSAVAYSHVAPAPPDLTPLERVVEDAREVEEAWKVKALAGESPDIAIPAFEAAKERRKAAEKALDEAREAAGLNDERLTMAEQWADMTVEDQNRTMLRFGASAIVTRSKSPVEDRVLLTFTTDDYRKAATSDDFQPDVVVEVLPDGGRPRGRSRRRSQRERGRVHLRARALSWPALHRQDGRTRHRLPPVRRDRVDDLGGRSGEP